MNLPIVRLEVEEMRHTILHHFSKYQSDLNEFVGQALKDVINNFNYADAVKKTAEPMIYEALEGYFKYGEGRSLIDSVISQTLKETFKEKEGKDANRKNPPS
jgi:hypothetical protein